MKFDFSDTAGSVVLFGITLLVSLSYLYRVLKSGRAQFERVDKQGGSVFLSKTVMEMAYWALQPIGRVLVFLKISPHTLTWFSLVFGFFAGLYLAYGFFGTAAIWASISCFLDTLDGMVARFRKIASNQGEVLDAVVDRYTEFFFIGGLIFYYRDSMWLIFISLWALMGCLMVSYNTAKAEAMGVEPAKGIMRRPERAFYLILGASLSPLSNILFETNRIKPLGIPMVVSLIFIAIFSNISVIVRFWEMVLALRLKEQK